MIVEDIFLILEELKTVYGSKNRYMIISDDGKYFIRIYFNDTSIYMPKTGDLTTSIQLEIQDFKKDVKDFKREIMELFSKTVNKGEARLSHLDRRFAGINNEN